jgi:uncharacterized protein
VSESVGKDTRMITARHVDGAEVRIPIGIVRGRRDGPIVCLVAGLHGSEYVGMEALRRVFRRLDTAELSGTVRLVFIANLPAFHGRSEAITPIDGKNLNRVFPGRARGGTYSEFLAHVLFEEVVMGSHCLVDLHGGDIFEALHPYIGLRPEGNEAVRAQARRLGEAYGIEHILVTRHLPGQGAVGMPLTAAALAAGIPAILAEAGGEGVLQEEFVQIHERGVVNVLREWRLLPGTPEIPVKPRHMHSYFWPAGATGVFYPLVRFGDRVTAGQKIAEIWDYFGTTRLQEITAPYDAVIIAVVTTPATQEGTIVFQVASETEQSG